jgi:hypothetical protein
VDDGLRRGYGFLNPEDLVGSSGADDDSRTNLALTGVWRSRPWLSTSAAIGYDRLATEVSRYSRVSRHAPSAATATIEAVASYGATRPMRTSIGAQYIRDDDRADTPEVQLHAKRTTAGMYLQHHVGWDERLFFTGVVRGDHVLDGPARGLLSSSADVSWAAVSATAGGATWWLGDLRLRAGYGYGGGHLIPTARFVQNNPQGGALETAERMKGPEAGLDASLLGDRVHATVTYYRAISDQALVVTRPSASSGYTGSIVSNDARIRSEGVESAIDARMIKMQWLRWDLGLALSAHAGEVLYHPGIPAVVTGAQYSATGASIGEYLVARYTYADANGDGLIATSEVIIDGDGLVPAGSPFPDTELGLRSSLTLGGLVRVSAVLDRRAGQKLTNYVEARRCTGSQPQCEAQHDPATPLAEQARAVAAGYFGEIVYLEDASYTKLREVSLSLDLPSRWMTKADLRGARLTVTGRNLATWTSYSGLDPETVGGDYDTAIATGGFYQPPLRSFSMRFDFAW